MTEVKKSPTGKSREPFRGGQSSEVETFAPSQREQCIESDLREKDILDLRLHLASARAAGDRAGALKVEAVLEHRIEERELEVEALRELRDYRLGMVKVGGVIVVSLATTGPTLERLLG